MCFYMRHFLLTLLTEAENEPSAILATTLSSKGIKASFMTTIINNFSCKRKEASKKQEA